MRTLTREQVREFDRRAIQELHVPGIVLMENAGRGCADLLRSRLPFGKVVLFCGKGNNGGDGFVIARHLQMAGCDVQIVLIADPIMLQGDAAINWDIALRLHIQTRVINPTLPPETLHAELSSLAAGANWIVDALLGTGAQGAPAPHYAAAIAAMNESGLSILAVDIPSGLDSDTGLAAGAVVQATLTATFVAPKPGLLQSDAAQFVGELIVIPIGVPVEWYFGL